MKSFLLAVSFLTKIPIPAFSSTSEDWRKSVVYYPAAGVVIGLLVWIFNLGTAQMFSPLMTSVLTFVFWIFITGGLHLDGWMDLGDALGSNRPREQMLSIMKDSRVGAMGVLSVIMLILVKGTALFELHQAHQGIWLMLIPAVARTHVLFTIRYWPYLSESGIASGMKNALQQKHILLSLILLFGFGWMIGREPGCFLIILTLLASLLYTCLVARRLGGMTGDCYGAVIEWNETVSLLVLLLLERWL